MGRGIAPRIAACVAAFAVSFSSYLWLTRGSDRPDADLRDLSAADEAATAGYAKGRVGVRLASFGAADDVQFAFKSESEPASAPTSFADRFAFDRASAPWTLQRAQGSVQASASFDDRFGGADAGVPARTERTRAVASISRLTSREPTSSIPARAAARPAVASAAPKRPQQTGFQLASASDTTLPLAYAPSDPVKSSLGSLAPKTADPLADVDAARTAIYDISSRTVYLPNGRRLEAHSGLGGHMDDARYVNMRMTGPTPPNVYELRMRESLFHGVRAIRLIPKDESKMYGRAGILAHSYLLGPSGQSNGCVSFEDYPAFLEAYLRGDITRLVVVEHLAQAPAPRTASDWWSNALKDIFGKS